MLNTQNKIWNATLYLRLSRDDGDKEESNSITGQRELLRDYIYRREPFSHRVPFFYGNGHAYKRNGVGTCGTHLCGCRQKH